MTRYHPFLVALHWILAILVTVALFMGGVILSNIPNSDPEKLFGLQAHMIAGMTILVLMLIRLVTRLVTAKPPHADTGNALLNKLGVLAHYALYLAVILMAGSGLATANLAGLPDIIFNGSGAPLPASFDEFAPRAAHGILAKVLGALLILHVVAALYHQFVIKDNLFARVWFGRRS